MRREQIQSEGPTQQEVTRAKRVDASINWHRKNLQVQDAKRREAVRKTDANITGMAYQSEPFTAEVLYSLESLDSLQAASDESYAVGAKVGEARNLLNYNPFNQEQHGVTFRDIMEMRRDPVTNELKIDDIDKINKYFRRRGVFKVGTREHHVNSLEALIHLATDKYVHPDEGKPRTKTLQNLQDNMCDFFDYYTSFITKFDVDNADQTTFLALIYLGIPYLNQGISTYLPARLNITPSSAAKLYKQHEVLAPTFLTRRSWTKYEEAFLPNFAHAYRPDALPPDLEKFQHYDPQQDARASEQLTPYLQRNASPDDQIAAKDAYDDTIGKWKMYKRDVIRGIMQEPQKRLTYSLSPNHPADSITMVRNRDTLVMIMQFAQETHMTLELTPDGKLYGIPADLIKAFPHVTEQMVHDVLSPVVTKYNLEDVQRNKVREDKVYDEDDVQRQRRLLPSVTLFRSDPEPPQRPREHAHKNFVPYTQESVRSLLPGRTSGSLEDDIMATLRDFENGQIHGVTVRDTSGPAVRLRSGNYRIIVDSLGNNRYVINRIYKS